MAETQPLAPLLAALRDLKNWMKIKQVPHIIIGGVAASILGRPRTTQDIDILVLLDERYWEEFLASGNQFSFAPRHSDSIKFAQKARVLLMRHEASGIDVDIVFGTLPFEKEAIAHSRFVMIGRMRIPLPRPEDLIIMKAISNRPRDQADIESILDAHPRLNWRRIRRVVRQFASAVEMPEILDDLERIMSRLE